MRHKLGRIPEEGASGPRLDDFIDGGHGLAKLTTAIDWHLLESRLTPIHAETAHGRPSQARVIAGLAILRELYGLLDDALFQLWLENPYYQLLCGERVFQHQLAYDRAALVSGIRRLTHDKLAALVQAAISPAANIETANLPELSRLGVRLEAATPAAGAKGPPRRGRNGEKPVSIYDVAKRAGVSIKTVSLVINRRPNVSLRTRTTVLAAIDALAYKPNVFARGLASERSFLIGLLHDVAPGTYIADLQLGALARCREEGYHLMVELVNPALDTDLSQRVRTLLSESVLHGVILTPPLTDETVLMEELTRAQTPFVRIAPGTQIPRLSAICIDEYKAAYEMTAYLIGIGHRRIAFVKGKPDHGAARLRFDGYRTALKDAGVPVVEELCAQGFFTYQSGLEAGERLLTLKQRPTAIFAGNDDMAAGVMAASQRLNLRIPDELSLAGFDDSSVAQVLWPRLTTCRQPIKEMAATAVSILTQKHAPEQPQVCQLAHELVVRESTAPPPA